MKNKLLYILFAAGLLVALTACEPKFDYKWTSYVVMDETSVSISEDDETGILSLGVTAYTTKGTPNTEVSFRVIDGDGDNGAKQGEDYYLLDHQSGMLYFEGESTIYINFSISNKDVGIYTGRKNFTVELTDASNGFDLGGAYKTTVSITDADRNLEATGIAGTYTAEGFGLVSSGTNTDATWEMTVIQHPTDPSLFYVYGLTPYAGGLNLATAGEEYWAIGYYGDASEETFVIPSQVCTGKVNTTSGGTYYIGYTPCVQYTGGGYYYSSQYPPMTFTMRDVDTWESDYGVFVVGCTDYDITSFTSYFGVVAPTVKITKID